jgi:hypothetical protein
VQPHPVVLPSGRQALSSDARKWTLCDNELDPRFKNRLPRGSALGRLVQVVHRRDPRARAATLASLAARRAGGPCAPTWASPAPALLAGDPSSIPPEAAGRLRALKIGKIKVTDCPQRLRRGACLKVLRQRIQPYPVIVLQGDELGHGLMPSLRPAAPVGGPSVSDPGRPVGMLRAKASLPLGGRHRLVTQGLRAWFHRFHNPLRNAFI